MIKNIRGIISLSSPHLYLSVKQIFRIEKETKYRFLVSMILYTYIYTYYFLTLNKYELTVITKDHITNRIDFIIASIHP